MTKSFYPKWRNDLEERYAQDFGLKYDQKVTKLSKGTLTKLQLLLAFYRGAELILLDEPTDGLDPPWRQSRNARAGGACG